MKALRWYGREDLRYEDVPEPSPKPDEVKIKVHLAGICGSDLHEYQEGPVIIPLEPHPVTGRMAPLTPGHEYSGEIVEVGDNITNFKIGDRVTGGAPVACGRCYYCLRNIPTLCRNVYYIGFHADGAMADYLVAPESTVYRLPDSISDDIGVITEPLAVGIHAVRRSRLQIGDTVVILGAGTIGLSTFLAARAAGASKIIVVEVSKRRAERAEKMGATEVINPKEVNAAEFVRGITDGIGADVSFDCVGNALSGPIATEFARDAGTVVIVGMSPKPSPDFNFMNIMYTEKVVLGSNGYTRDTATAIELIADGRIDPSLLITDRVPLKDAVEKGFRELISNPEGHLKVLLQP